MALRESVERPAVALLCRLYLPVLDAGLPPSHQSELMKHTQSGIILINVKVVSSRPYVTKAGCLSCLKTGLRAP